MGLSRNTKKSREMKDKRKKESLYSREIWLVQIRTYFWNSTSINFICSTNARLSDSENAQQQCVQMRRPYLVIQYLQLRENKLKGCAEMSLPHHETIDSLKSESITWDEGKFWLGTKVDLWSINILTLTDKFWSINITTNSRNGLRLLWQTTLPKSDA